MTKKLDYIIINFSLKKSFKFSAVQILYKTKRRCRLLQRCFSEV